MGFGLETRVGLFMIVSVVILAVLGITFGKISFTGDKTYPLSFEIVDASGLKNGTKVYYRGIKVGTLLNIKLKDEVLTADVEISENYQIPNNVDFAIRQAGFVGERTIELIPNKAVKITGTLMPNGMYDGRQAGSSLENVMDSINLMAEQIGKLAESVNEIVSQDDTKELLQETMVSVKSIAASIDTVLVANNETLTGIVTNIEKATMVLNRIIESNEDNIGSTINNIDQLAITLKDLSVTLNKFVVNNEEELSTSIKSISTLSEKISTTVTNIEAISEDIVTSKGTIGMLINDNKTKEELQQAITGVKDLVSLTEGFKYYMAFGGDYIINANKARGFAELKLMSGGNSFIQFGVSNTPHRSPRVSQVEFKYRDANGVEQTGSFTREESYDNALALSLQVGRIFNNLVGVRAGFFDSAIGLGIDIYPLRSHSLVVSAEAYDFRNNKNKNNRFEVYTRAFVRYHFLKHFFVQAGVEDLIAFNKLTFNVGAGVVFMDDSLTYEAAKKRRVEAAAKAKAEADKKTLEQEKTKNDKEA